VTTRHEVNYRILNGPHGGDALAGPAGAPLGSAMCLGFDGPRGMEYAVYVLVDTPASKGPGLAFVRAWPTPGEAQQHAHNISLSISVAREAARSN